MIEAPPPIAPQIADILALVEKLPIDTAPAALKPILMELRTATRDLDAAAHRFDRAALALSAVIGVMGGAPQGDT